MALQIGDVIRVWDRWTKPPKEKRHICICPDGQLFLRINSKALFPPHLMIRAVTTNFLDHDSYVELQQLIRLYASDISEAEVIGRLNLTHVTALTIAVGHCEALSGELKSLITDRLKMISMK
ncbi:hypothetical protein EFD56_03230 [Rhizobium phaseoli]|uniref:hypothetical protein n=1 Tax=Rhizobium phaseoli TaxID=396 RepID=UPI000F86CE9A|nr:hypothetical protein [Rhizobium phaseoli]RUM21508.1 hypothetical protein EFD56_03230 [Rhizobium phaseoli]